jgi:hypothetical protein
MTGPPYRLTRLRPGLIFSAHTIEMDENLRLRKGLNRDSAFTI